MPVKPKEEAFFSSPKSILKLSGSNPKEIKEDDLTKEELEYAPEIKTKAQKEKEKMKQFLLKNLYVNGVIKNSEKLNDGQKTKTESSETKKLRFDKGQNKEHEHQLLISEEEQKAQHLNDFSLLQDGYKNRFSKLALINAKMFEAINEEVAKCKKNEALDFSITPFITDMNI